MNCLQQSDSPHISLIILWNDHQHTKAERCWELPLPTVLDKVHYLLPLLLHLNARFTTLQEPKVIPHFDGVDAEFGESRCLPTPHSEYCLLNLLFIQDFVVHFVTLIMKWEGQLLRQLVSLERSW